MTGNIVKGHGNEPETLDLGALYFRNTEGLTVGRNVVIEAGGYAFHLHHTNFGFSLGGNTVIDVWSTTNSSCAAVYANGAGYNTGSINGLTLVAGAKSATHKNKRGIYQNDASNSAVETSGNNLTAATDPIQGSGIDSIRETVRGTLVPTRPTHAADGTDALPSYSFGSDTDTGMYLNSAGQLAFAVAGGRRARLTATSLNLQVDIGFNADNANDVGGSGARARDVYAARHIRLGSLYLRDNAGVLEKSTDGSSWSTV